MLLDTGSFELWVNPNCSATNVRQFCDEFGHYDPTLSPTSKNLNKTFTIQYGLGSASGTYLQDDVFISGKLKAWIVKLKDVEERVVYNDELFE